MIELRSPSSRFLQRSSLVLVLVALASTAYGDSFAPGYDLIRDDGTDENRRGALNLIGSVVSCADDSANNETECTITGGTGDVTAVGDCTTGACFDGTNGSVLTFLHSATTGDIAFTSTSGTRFEILDDLILQEADPLLTWIDSTAAQDDFSIAVNTSTFTLSNLTDSVSILAVDSSNDTTLDNFVFLDTSDNRMRVGSGLIAPPSDLSVMDEAGTADFVIMSSGGDESLMQFYESRGTLTSPSIVLNGDLSEIDFLFYNTSYGTGASIIAQVDGTPGSAGDTSDMPTRLEFWTTPDGAGTAVERLTIDNAGLIHIGAGTGVTLVDDGDGAITFKGESLGADEDLTLNLDDTSDVGTYSSSTGLTNLTYTSIGSTWGALVTANANLTIGNGATTAGVLTLLEDTDAGSNFASFQVPALTDNTVYILPADDGDADQVLSTNGTGTLDWVTSSGTGDITDVYNCASGDCATITMGATDTLVASDGSLINFAAASVTTTTEGIILSQHATSCSAATAEGQVCWENDADKLWVGDGAAPKEVGSGSSPFQTTSNVANLVTSTDTVTIGSATALGKLAVDGDADEIQLLIQANATQTTSLATFENSAGTDQFTLSNAGVLVATGTGTFGGTDQSTITEGLVVNNGAGTDEDDDFTVNVSGAAYEIDAGAGTLTSTANDAGWTAVDQTDNQACTTGCTSACLFGVANATGTAVTGIVSCSDTTADTCMCMGGS